MIVISYHPLHTVDGRNPAPVDTVGSLSQIFTRLNCIPGGAGFVFSINNSTTVTQ